MSSPLTQGRELKCMAYLPISAGRKSPLTQGRELKYVGCNIHNMGLLSPLTQGRELKFLLTATDEWQLQVAPHTGA